MKNKKLYRKKVVLSLLGWSVGLTGSILCAGWFGEKAIPLALLLGTLSGLFHSIVWEML